MAVKAKYRELTSQELQGLEKEFIDYLIVNGITADDWVKIKKDEKQKAEDIITLFSDVVLEGVLRKVQFLEFRVKSDIKSFQCLSEKIVMVGLSSDNPNIDFTDSNFFANTSNLKSASIKIHSAEKSYSVNREMELFNMIESGCQIADGHSFKAISLALVD